MNETQEYAASSTWLKVETGEVSAAHLFSFNGFGCPWEEFSLIKNDDHVKLAALNALLKQGYFVAETTVVGDSVLFRINKLLGA